MKEDELKRQWISWTAISGITDLPDKLTGFARGEAERLERIYGDEVRDTDNAEVFGGRMKRAVTRDTSPLNSAVKEKAMPTNDEERRYWLALRVLQRRGIKPERAADWTDGRLLAVPGFGRAKLEGWRSVFPVGRGQEA